MAQLLGLVLLSFILTGILIVPFIDLLFHLKRRFLKKVQPKEPEEAKADIPITNAIYSGSKQDVPQGGGILIILILLFLSNLLNFFIPTFDVKTLLILNFTIITFGGLGAVDDVRKLFVQIKGKFLGLGRKNLIVIQTFLALIIGAMLYYFVGLNNIYIPILGNFVIGPWYIPFAAFVIVAFSNSYNISDGLDGLSSGLLVICLFAFLALASVNFDTTLATFIGIWIGALLAFLYFNVWPARIFLGDGGGFGFGATLAVVGLLTGKVIGLGFIGGIFIVIAASSFLQIFSKKVFKRKILPVAPIHLYFRYIGWEESKVVTRFWLVGAIFAIFGLWLALIHV